MCKIRIYKTLIRPVLTYASEAWTLTKKDINRLNIFERKVLRSIFGPVNVDNEWRARYNYELHELFGEPNITSFIKMGRLRWAGHVIRLEDSRPAIRVLRYEPGGSRRRGRPKIRWEDGIREDARTIGVKNWMSVARNRDEWRKLLWTARTHDGLSS